jgi:hypothetical protein
MFFHGEIFCKRRKVFPWLNERIAEHGVFHQPDAERQYDLSTEPRWKLAVEYDDAPARAKHLPGMTKHHEVVRHGIVG